MKIALIFDLVYPYEIGGAQKRVWDIALRLVRRGHDVTIFGMKYWEGEEIIYKDGVRLWGVCPVVNIWAGRRRSIKEAIYFARHLLSPLMKEKFDIVDCQSFPYFSCFSAKIASIFRKEPLVITWYEVWDKYWYEYLGKVKGIAGRIIERSVLILPAKIIPISNRIRKDLVTLGVKENKLIVVFNGSDVEAIRQIQPAKKQIDIIYVGRLAEHKNVNILLDAVALIRKQIPNISCVVIGDGPERERLVNQANQLNLQGNVEFLGFLQDDKDVISYMRASKVFVLPSIREGFPNTIIEANACGLPAIIVDSPKNASTDVVINGQNGFITELNAESISSKIIETLGNETLRNNMALSALQCSKKYDWPIVITELENAYAEVINNA